MQLIIITGMSGSGKFFALDVFEDMGFYAMDNLAPALIPKFCEMALDAKSKNFEKVAVVMDLRSGEFFDSIYTALNEVKSMHIDLKIIFLYADLNTIIGRYKEQRRPHPMNKSIVEGYKFEEEALSKIKNDADFVIDTSELSTKNLRKQLMAFMSYDQKDNFPIEISSFGYKDGILKDADIVFDVRFLPNPYYIEEYRNLNGLNEEVKNFVLKWDVTKEFIDRSIDFFKFLIPNYMTEQKRVLKIGIGCTGGFHRSVVIAEKLGEILKKDYSATYVTHRDMEKNLWKKR